EGDSIVCFAMQNRMVKTSLRTGFANMPPACWIEMGSNPPFWSSPAKKAPPCGDAFLLVGEGGFEPPKL
ncbi:MAG: hypothetical protein SOZ90_02100, partial [Candidatus Faecousia sp.]|nr:hypothetical protein [Candidatus Faecousia sp.]